MDHKAEGKRTCRALELVGVKIHIHGCVIEMDQIVHSIIQYKDEVKDKGDCTIRTDFKHQIKSF